MGIRLGGWAVLRWLLGPALDLLADLVRLPVQLSLSGLVQRGCR